MFIRKVQIESFNELDSKELNLNKKYLVFGHNDLLNTKILDGKGSFKSIYDDLMCIDVSDKSNNLIQNFYLINDGDEGDDEIFWKKMEMANLSCLLFVNTKNKISNKKNLQIYYTLDNYDYVIAIYGNDLDDINMKINDFLNENEILIRDLYKLFFSNYSTIESVGSNTESNAKMNIEIIIKVKKSNEFDLENIKNELRKLNIDDKNIKIEEISGSKDLSINIDQINIIQFLSLYKPQNVFSFNRGYNRVFTCNTKLKTEKKSHIYDFKENSVLTGNSKFTWTNGKIFNKNTSYAIHLMRINQYMKNTKMFNIPDYGYLILYLSVCKFQEKINMEINSNESSREFIQMYIEYAKEIMDLNQASQIGYYTSQEYVRKEIHAPIKLIALYTAFTVLSCKIITEAENSFIDKKPSFIFCLKPSVAENVFTSILFSNDQLKDDRLLLINIPIEYIYNIKIMIFSLLHEESHYCGEYIRSRKDRASFIVHSYLCEIIEHILMDITVEQREKYSIENKIEELFKILLYNNKYHENDIYYLTNLKKVIIDTTLLMIKQILISSKIIFERITSEKEDVQEFVNISKQIKRNCIEILCKNNHEKAINNISELFSESYSDFFAISFLDLDYKNYEEIMTKTYKVISNGEINSDFVTLRILVNYFLFFSTDDSIKLNGEIKKQYTHFIEYINNDNIETRSEEYKKIMSKFKLDSTKNNTNKRLSKYFMSPEIMQDIIEYLCICNNKFSELKKIIDKERFSKLKKCLNDDSIDVCFINEVIGEFRELINSKDR